MIVSIGYLGLALPGKFIEATPNDSHDTNIEQVRWTISHAEYYPHPWFMGTLNSVTRTCETVLVELSSQT
jgi:hypothetical protein